MRQILSRYLVPLLGSPISSEAGPGGRSCGARGLGAPRLVIYYQTTHDSNNNPISMLPLITEKNIALTHLIVCSFHINSNSEIHLNDFPRRRPLRDPLAGGQGGPECWRQSHGHDRGRCSRLFSTRRRWIRPTRQPLSIIILSFVTRSDNTTCKGWTWTSSSP